MAKTLKEIVVEYANTRGGGLPVTPEEMCNALTLWVQEQFSNEKIKALFPDIVGATTNYVTYNPQDNEYTISVKSSSTESADLWAGVDGLKASVKEQWIKDNFFNAIDLSELFEGSETVDVDVNDTNNKIEIHLDADVVNKLERAILTPNSIEPEKRVPYIHPNGSVRYADIVYTYIRYIAFEVNNSNTSDFMYQIGFNYPCKENKAINSIDELLDELSELPSHESKTMINGFVIDNNGDTNIAISVEISHDFDEIRTFAIDYGYANKTPNLLEHTIEIVSDSLLKIIDA